MIGLRGEFRWLVCGVGLVWIAPVRDNCCELGLRAAVRFGARCLGGGLRIGVGRCGIALLRLDLFDLVAVVGCLGFGRCSCFGFGCVGYLVVAGLMVCWVKAFRVLGVLFLFDCFR